MPRCDRCRQHLALSDEERLLLRMICQVGRILGVSAHPSGRMSKRVLVRIVRVM